MKRIAIIGSTGSIGTQTLDVIREHPERFQVEVLTCGRNIKKLREQIEEFHPSFVVVSCEEDLDGLRAHLPAGTKAAAGGGALLEAAAYPSVDFMMNALVGSRGLEPTLSAIKAGKTIGIANKETLVTAGHLVVAAAKEHGAELLAVDSEHSAILQSLQGSQRSEVERIILTASGGSFRDWTAEQLEHATPKDALKHPNWTMGKKVTIDSATMMNKGLEVIEAHWLFEMPYEKIDVLLHRESIIHSLVEYQDSSMIAQLGTPNMRVAIQYALAYPERLELQETGRLNLWETGKLHFEKTNEQKHRCLMLAYEAGKRGGSAPTVLNAANEAAVALFLEERISFLAIAEVVEESLAKHRTIAHPTVEEVLAIDSAVREQVFKRLI